MLEIRRRTTALERVHSAATRGKCSRHRSHSTPQFHGGGQTVEYAARILTEHSIPSNYDAEGMFVRLAKDAGLPIYERLVAGPQSRKSRTKRPLRSSGEADIYQAVLLALAETGPKSSVSYDELRSSLNAILSDMVPQKHEVTAALKHLAAISMKAGTEVAIDWDEDKREVNLTDPYLRFFLRWQVRSGLQADESVPISPPRS